VEVDAQVHRELAGGGQAGPAGSLPSAIASTIRSLICW
jgi:hypothetical protein